MRKSVIKLVLLSVTICLILILANCAQPAPDPAPQPSPQPSPTPQPVKTFNLSLATHTPEMHYMVKEGFIPWADELEKRTNGQVKITIHPSGALGKPNETLEMVKSGIADIALVVPAFHAGLFKLCDVWELPYLLKYDEKSRLAGDMVFEKYIESTEFKDVKVLWYHRWEPETIMTTDKAIRKMEDAKGTVLGIPGGKVSPEFVKLIGGSPEYVIIPDIYTALEKGMLDGQIFPVQMELAYKWLEVTKYVTMINSGSGTAMVSINQQVWDSLPSDVKDVMNELSPWVKDLQREASDAATENAVAVCKDKGLEIIDLSQSELDRWIEATKVIEDNWASDMDAEGLPGTQMIEEVRAAVGE